VAETHPDLEIQKELQKTAKQMTIIKIFSQNPLFQPPPASIALSGAI
jgi:hypothetical protein